MEISRERLDDVASAIEVNNKDISDIDLFLNLKAEIISMHKGLNELAEFGKSKEHPILNEQPEEIVKEIVADIYHYRIEFGVFKDTVLNDEVYDLANKLNELEHADPSNSSEHDIIINNSRFIIKKITALGIKNYDLDYMIDCCNECNLDSNPLDNDHDILVAVVDCSNSCGYNIVAVDC